MAGDLVRTVSGDYGIIKMIIEDIGAIVWLIHKHELELEVTWTAL